MGMGDDKTYNTDMIIIGAGPVGLFAVFEAGLLGLRCHLIDNLDRPGGQCTELYPEKPIFDIPSRPEVSGQQLVDDLMEQARPFSPEFHLSQQAESLVKLENGNWQVTTTRGHVIEAPIVVVAVGAGSFVPKKPPFERLEEFEEKSVNYAVYRMDKYRNKKLVIVGGGDSALDWALSLAPVAKHVTLIHRREEFRGATDTAQQVYERSQQDDLDIVFGNVTGLEGNNGELTHLEVTTLEGDIQEIDCDYMLPFLGLKVNLGPIANWGLNLNRKNVEVSQETFSTDTPGIYSIGDVCTYPGKLKLILTGFYEAAVMVRAAFKYGFPDQKIARGYSSTSSVIRQRLGVDEK